MSPSLQTKEKPNFLLGIGCQKGGTTWLHDYLSSLPDTCMSEPKELHIFDSLFLPDEHSGSYIHRYRELGNILNNATPHDVFEKKVGHEIVRILNMYYDLGMYVDYFKKCAAAPAVKLVGEITPDYSELHKDHFEKIYSLLEPHFTIKVVFLMRDPIERIYSFIRMQYQSALRGGRTLEHSVEKYFATSYKARICEALTRYEKTISNIEAVFPSDTIYYDFYEHFFQEPRIQELCDFLEIDYSPPNFSRRLNTTQKTLPLDPATIKAARQYYGGTYELCAQKFGQGFIKKLWPHY